MLYLGGADGCAAHGWLVGRPARSLIPPPLARICCEIPVDKLPQSFETNALFWEREEQRRGSGFVQGGQTGEKGKVQMQCELADFERQVLLTTQIRISYCLPFGTLIFWLRFAGYIPNTLEIECGIPQGPYLLVLGP